MSAQPELAFDVCWKFIGAREVLDLKRGVWAQPEGTGEILWKPGLSAR